MNEKLNIHYKYIPTDKIVVRNIDNEIVLVPFVSGTGDLEDDLLSFNETGKEIWEYINQAKYTVTEIAIKIHTKYSESNYNILMEEVSSFFDDLLKRKIIIKN